ncbi:unnamed protein product, partial [Staurois parvus]
LHVFFLIPLFFFVVLFSFSFLLTFFHSSSFSDIVNAGSGEIRYSECRVRGDQI